MMDREEFWNGWEPLTQAFTVTKPEKKQEIYFTKLQKLSGYTWQKTCDYILQTHSKFPTIADILAESVNFSPKGTGLAQCSECCGNGLVALWNHAFRARCIHGERPPKFIPLVPISFDEKNLWYGRLNRQWNELYGKDLVEGQAYAGTPIEPIIQKIKNTFGVE